MKSRTVPHEPGPDRRPGFLEALAACGNVSQACADSGLPRTTAYRLRKQDEAFGTAWSEALDAGTDALEDEAVRRAVDGVEEEVFYGGKPVGTQRRYSDSLLVFLLKARRPAKYRERAEGGDDKAAASKFQVILRDENGNVVPPQSTDD